MLDKSPPNQIRCRTLGIATTIAATITDNRNKTISIRLYGLPCRLAGLMRVDIDFVYDLATKGELIVHKYGRLAAV